MGLDDLPRTTARTGAGGREVELEEEAKLIGADEQPKMWMPRHQGPRLLANRGGSSRDVGRDARLPPTSWCLSPIPEESRWNG
jgi:hypothetical protein